MKSINRIQIENVKGISKLDIKLDLIPNKPTIFVAPNGTGKSSFALAFDSLNRNRLDLSNNDCHCNDDTLEPKIKLTYSDDNKNVAVVQATSKQNTIKDNFDVVVIRGMLKPSYTRRKINGQTCVSPWFEIPNVTLIPNIPPKANLQYSFRNSKLNFGKNGKILPNIDKIIADGAILEAIDSGVELEKSSQVKVIKAISAFRDFVNSLDGNSEQIFDILKVDGINDIAKIPLLRGIAQVLKERSQYSNDAECYLAAIQLVQIYSADTDMFKKHLKRCVYERRKARILSYFELLKGTWKKIKPAEKNGHFELQFPEARCISNGERDILYLVARLLCAEARSCDKRFLLIIDEIFDYLDDANLIVAQYHLSKMIQHYKDAGKLIYPIILTHLDPGYFKAFCFRKQKVYYIFHQERPQNSPALDIIVARQDAGVADSIARYFLHYNPLKKDLKNEFKMLKLDVNLSDSDSFKKHVIGHLEEYLAEKAYDPIAACCALRIIIEESVYKMLQPGLQNSFIDMHKTVDKLSFADNEGADVPEPYFALGIIYNPAMHIRDKQQDHYSPLFSKLNNNSVRSIIDSIYREYSRPVKP